MKFYFSILFCMGLFVGLNAQKLPNFWTETNLKNVDLKKAIDYSAEIRNFSTFQLAEVALINALDQVPKRFSGTNSTIQLKIPNGNGSYIDFKMYESNLLPESWKTKYPNLRSYYGISAHSSLRLTVTPMGIYGMIQQPKKQIIINPLTDDSYMVFEKKNASIRWN